MKIIETIAEMKAFQRQIDAGRVGFVPTMGYLHEGHLSLIRASKKENQFTVVSIFVNPLQFGPMEDLSKYPRNWDRDRQLLQAEGVDAVFLPSVAEMYPDDMLVTVAVDKDFSSRACGYYRPGHFEGVATIVLKLFNIVGPCQAYFGLKDYQQFVLIQRMIENLNLQVTIKGLPTLRESDGLAMSSRNTNLSAEDRLLAPNIYKLLCEARDELLKSNKLSIAKETFFSKLESISPRFRVQYLECYDRAFESLESLAPGHCVLVVAVYLGDVRLIDNLLF